MPVGKTQIKRRLAFLPFQTFAQGPRVRMGVHWALPGLVACRSHALTKAPMVVGIAVSIAQEVGTALGEPKTAWPDFPTLRSTSCLPVR